MDEHFWTDRYEHHNTPWDLGKSSPPLIAYLQRIHHKDLKILIPGAGNGYDSEWLYKHGFHNSYVLDISHVPLDNLKRRVPQFPSERLLMGDFFNLKEKFDLIIEQTFFCALEPHQRKDYVKKMHEILKPGGRLVGVLFDFPLTDQGPPFGGSSEEYEDLFSEYFNIYRMERCYNSIKPRSGNELFFELIKP